jgi:hypothetical protein
MDLIHKGTRLFLCMKMNQERSKGKGGVDGGRKGGGRKSRGGGEILG